MKLFDKLINKMTDRMLKDEVKSTLEMLIYSKEHGLTLDDVINLYKENLSELTNKE